MSEEKNTITISLAGNIEEAPRRYHPEFDLCGRALKAYRILRTATLSKRYSLDVGKELTPEQVFKLLDAISDVGVREVLDLLRNKHEMKVQTPYGTGPSGNGWINTGCFVVEVAAKKRGKVEPTGIMVPELSDDSTFWNILVDHDMKPVYTSCCKVGLMRRFIQRRLDEGVEGRDWGWGGIGGRAKWVKVPIPKDDPAAMDAWDMIEAERNRTPQDELLVTKKAYQKFKEQQANV